MLGIEKREKDELLAYIMAQILVLVYMYIRTIVTRDGDENEGQTKRIWMSSERWRWRDSGAKGGAVMRRRRRGG